MAKSKTTDITVKVAPIRGRTRTVKVSLKKPSLQEVLEDAGLSAQGFKIMVNKKPVRGMNTAVSAGSEIVLTELVQDA